jgi:CRP-like cAMP-binding protein
LTAQLTKAAIFRGVDEAVAADIADRLWPVAFSEGDVIYRAGDRGDRLFVIAEGKVKIGSSSVDGREQLFAVAGPSDVFGELAMFDPSPRSETATALTEVRGFAMDRDTVLWWLSRRSEVAELLLRLLARRIRRAVCAVTNVVSTEAPARIAAELLGLAQQFGVRNGNVILVDHGLTQSELAQLVGTSRETVCKVLQEFRHRGWIEPLARGAVIYDAGSLARQRQF